MILPLKYLRGSPACLAQAGRPAGRLCRTRAVRDRHTTARKKEAHPPAHRRSCGPPARRSELYGARARERDEPVIEPPGDGLIAGHDLDLPALQAGRHLHPAEVDPLPFGVPQRLGDLGLGSEQAHISWRRQVGAVDRRRAGLVVVAPGSTSAAATGGPGSTTTVGLRGPSGGGHDEPGGGADRLEDLAPAGNRRLPAIRARHRLPVEIRPALPRGAQGSGDPSSRGSSSTISRSWKRPTTSAVRSSAVDRDRRW